MQVRLMLETAAALVMFSDAWPRFNRRVLFYLTAPACVTVPIGGYVLVNVDAFLMRKVVASVVVVFALALLSGLRYSGAPRPATSLALGSIVGVLLGATSVGAPPVIPRERKTCKDHHGDGRLSLASLRFPQRLRWKARMKPIRPPREVAPRGTLCYGTARFSWHSRACHARCETANPT